MIFPKYTVIMAILQASAPLYEIAVGTTTGKTPMKVGVLFELFNQQDEDAILNCDKAEGEMAKELLEYVYGSGPAPEWVS